jgi:putative flippase GtrA
VFLGVGGLTAILQLGVFALLQDVAELGYRLSISISYITAVAFHFLMNRYVTFRSGDATLRQSLHRYLLLVGVNYLITLAVMEVFVGMLHGPEKLAAAAAIAATVGVTYLASRYWIFSGGRSRRPARRAGTDEG